MLIYIYIYNFIFPALKVFGRCKQSISEWQMGQLSLASPPNAPMSKQNINFRFFRLIIRSNLTPFFFSWALLLHGCGWVEKLKNQEN